jgi:hypothetical protein
MNMNTCRLGTFVTTASQSPFFQQVHAFFSSLYARGLSRFADFIHVHLLLQRFSQACAHEGQGHSWPMTKAVSAFFLVSSTWTLWVHAVYTCAPPLTKMCSYLDQLKSVFVKVQVQVCNIQYTCRQRKMCSSAHKFSDQCTFACFWGFTEVQVFLSDTIMSTLLVPQHEAHMCLIEATLHIF